MKRIVQIDEFFGHLIAAKRKNKGLDQKQFAARLGIQQPALSRIERGDSAVNTSMLVKLADALGVPPSELIIEFEREKRRLEVEESVDVKSKKDLPTNQATLGKVLLGGAALALIIGAINK